MNNNHKYLIWAGTLALIMLTIFLATAAKQIKNTAATTNTISFNGEGKVFAVPDVAVVSFSIVTEAATSKTAQDANSGKSKKVVDFLRGQGIEDKDIKTTGYNIYPQYSYPRPIPLPLGVEGQSYPQYYDSNPKITGYQVAQSFEVKVRNLEKISAVLDGLVAAGANQVNQLGFKIDDEEKLKDEARTKAIANAKKKAATLQKQIGIRLGKIVNYQEGGYYPPIYFAAEAKLGDRGGDVSGPSVPTGENEVVVNVTITYQIK